MKKQARITSKGQITVPREIRRALGVQPGDASAVRGLASTLRWTQALGWATKGIGRIEPGVLDGVRSRKGLEEDQQHGEAGQADHADREDADGRLGRVAVQDPGGLGIPRLDIPQLDGVVPTRRSQPFSVAGKGDAFVCEAWVSWKFHPDTSGSEIPHLDAAVVGDRDEQIGVPGTERGASDSILIFEQQLFLSTGKIVEGERLSVVENEQIAIEEQRRSVLVVGAAEDLVALVLAEVPEIAPLKGGHLARRWATGVNQIVGPLEIAFLPRLEG